MTETETTMTDREKRALLACLAKSNPEVDLGTFNLFSSIGGLFQKSDGSGAIDVSSKPDLKAGSSDKTAITELQTLLTDAGFDTKGVDGVFGADTTTAVKALQKSRGLAQTGVADQGVWQALAVLSLPPEAAADKAAKQQQTVSLITGIATAGLAAASQMGKKKGKKKGKKGAEEPYVPIEEPGNAGLFIILGLGFLVVAGGAAYYVMSQPPPKEE